LISTYCEDSRNSLNFEMAVYKNKNVFVGHYSSPPTSQDNDQSGFNEVRFGRCKEKWKNRFERRHLLKFFD